MILLDTHVLVWLIEGQSDLGRSARTVVASALSGNELAVSAITFWEIAMLEIKYRLRLSKYISAWRADVLDLGILELPVTGEIGIKAVLLDLPHRDPADRIIAATASFECATLVTSDEKILEWNSTLNRIDARR